jgi:glutamate N-acetyltransferase/amino-acid N-acetyltransferase
MGDSERVCEGVAKAFSLKSKDLVLPSSTGIIGWRLPVDALVNAMPKLIPTLQSESILPAALGITTTDRYPKVRSRVAKSKAWSVVGIAKGAGMIEPNMATMLAYILTDLKVPRETLDKCLKSAVKSSFNCISVDGDQSTSDTCFLLSSEVVEPTSTGSDEKEFEAALLDVCRELAEDIVRNGEGTNHVIKATVTGAPTDIVARDIGRFVCNSNLVKCAIAGCDPNVGRIVGAIGSYLGTIEGGAAMTAGLSVTLGGVDIFNNGAFQLDPVKEKTLSDYMLEAQLYPADVLEHDRLFPLHDRCVEMEIKLGYDAKATGKSVVIGSDLTKEYVEVNADYRS